ncbi:MAG: hypothetical protein AB3X41_07705 [Leptothrix ochracea]|uniref:hypothetical protein n=1 Tax=Leptothrix ochracea TaxID=735331 RepID=UPI0034E2A720
MNRLVTQLVLPLVAATALAILVHLRWPADGFFLNLAAGFVGSLVTVGYIDWILRRHERERWKEADSRIQARLSKLASVTITEIRTSLGYGTEVFDRVAMGTGSAEVMRKEVLRVAIHVLSPTAEARIAALDQEQWRSFAANLQRASAECGVLLDRFGHRLEPEMIAVVLDLQQHLESAQTFWRVFPDVAGVPVAQLPKMKGSPEEMQAAWCGLAARDIRRVLELSTMLSVETSDVSM